MLKMKFFWLIFRGKFEQKTQKSIFLKNQWRLKNIKKAMVVKNIIAEDMPFTKSIFEQFWRSYCKKTIFVVFHFLKFLPLCNKGAEQNQIFLQRNYQPCYFHQVFHKALDQNQTKYPLDIFSQSSMMCWHWQDKNHHIGDSKKEKQVNLEWNNTFLAEGYLH